MDESVKKARQEQRKLQQERKKERKKQERELKKQRAKERREEQKRINEATRELNKRRRRAKKRQNMNVRAKNNYLAPISGYYYTPSYIQAGNRYGTILKVQNRYGLNHQNQFGWFINIIPDITVDDVKAYLIEADKLMDTKTQDDIFKKEIHKTIKANDSSNDSNNETSGDRRIKDMMMDDLEDASQAESQSQSAVDVHIYVLLVSDDPDKLADQLRKLNTVYKDTMHGIELTSVAGSQQKLFENMIAPPTGSKYEYTWMSGDFSGNDHAVRKGLDDYDGVAVGDLTESYSTGTALMALDRSLKRRGLVASYDYSKVLGFEEEEGMSASSLWGQRIANDVMTHNKRVFHIVLNGFHYEADEETVEGEKNKFPFAIPPVVNLQLERVDLSKGGLNPLEMFGELEDITEIYNANLDKIVRMFHLMSGRDLTMAQRTMLRKALNQFYMSRGMWTDDAYKNPKSTRLIGLRHETVPVMGNFIQNLTNLVSKSTTGTSQKDLDDAKVLRDVLETALNTHQAIFNQHSTLIDPRDITKMQVYYDLSRLMNQPDMMEAQFLNAFDYIALACRRDDVIMIHGVDKLSTDTLRLLETRIASNIRRGVRMVYLFDRIGSGKEHKHQVKRADVFNTEGILYNNLDTDFGYTIFGTMNQKDLANYQSQVKQKLTRNLKDILTDSNSPFQYQIRRQLDYTTVMVLANFLV